MAIQTQGAIIRLMTQAERVRADADPYAKAIALMVWRDCQPTYVIFHFEDGSSVTFKKSYELA